MSDGLYTRIYLVEASMEDSLHSFVVERDSLDLAALVFVVEGHSLAGGCEETQEQLTLGELRCKQAPPKKALAFICESNVILQKSKHVSVRGTNWISLGSFS